MKVKMKNIDSLEVVHGDFVIVVDVKVLQKILHIQIINLIWHVKVLENQFNYILDFLSSQVSVMSLVEDIKEHPYRNDNLLELRLWLRQLYFQNGRAIDGNFLQDKPQLADSLKVFSCQVSFVRNIVIKKEIVDILLSNWIVQAELGENLGENFGDLKTCQVLVVASVVLGEESFDGYVDGSCFFRLSSC